MKPYRMMLCSSFLRVRRTKHYNTLDKGESQSEGWYIFLEPRASSKHFGHSRNLYICRCHNIPRRVMFRYSTRSTPCPRCVDHNRQPCRPTSVTRQWATENWLCSTTVRRCRPTKVQQLVKHVQHYWIILRSRMRLRLSHCNQRHSLCRRYSTNHCCRRHRSTVPLERAKEWLNYIRRYVEFKQLPERASLALLARLMRDTANTWFTSLTNQEQADCEELPTPVW